LTKFEKQKINWEKQRAKGKTKYVLFHMILSLIFAAIFAAIFAIIDILIFYRAFYHTYSSHIDEFVIHFGRNS
jgi:hypothetical protein